jgi:CRP-like cAMP-binding protein
VTLSQFFQKNPVRSFPKSKILINPEEVLDYVYFLENGEVRMYSVSTNGRETTLHIFKPGTAFPLMLVLSGVENQYYFECKTAVQIRQSPREEVINFLKENPDEQHSMLINLSKGIVGLLTRIDNLTNLTTAEQVKSLLDNVANRDISQQEIADWLGISRETVSRAVGHRRPRSGSR